MTPDQKQAAQAAIDNAYEAAKPERPSDPRKIQIELSYKEYKPEIEGFRDIATGYKIAVTRIGGGGLTEIETRTALQMYLNNE